MRNLKRALSLAVSTVMLMGMMVVGSGAAGYDDVSSEHNQEAIDVLQAIGVMVGDGENFNPDQNVTREEMAVIMCQLLDYTVSSYQGLTRFTDVSDWARPYVEACYTNGIIAGYSDTQFGGADPVTTGQAGLMMLKALEYFQYQGDFDNNGGWILATIRQAADIDLYDGIDAETEQPLTRNDIAQLALNTLESDMVRFTGDVGMEVDMGNGQSVTVGFNSEYSPVSESNYNYNGAASGSHDEEYRQLTERLYGNDLRKATSSADDLGRPANTWTYEGDEIGTYNESADDSIVINNDDDATMSSVLTSSDYFNLRNSSIASSVDYNLNGDPAVASNPLQAGDVVEIFRNDNNEVDTVVVIQYQLAKIDDVDTDVSDSDARDDVTAYISLENLSGGAVGQGTYDDTDINGYNASTYEEGTFLAVALNAAGEIVDSYVADTAEGTVTAYRNDHTRVTLDGTAYEISAMRDTASVSSFDFDDTAYILYLTNESYVLGIDGAEAINLDDVYYVHGAYMDQAANGNTTYYAQVVDMDGVESEIEIEATTFINTFKAHENTSDAPVTGKLYDVGGLYTFTDNDAKTGNNPYYNANEDEIKQENSVTPADPKTSNDKYSAVVYDNDAADGDYYISVGGLASNVSQSSSAISISGGTYSRAYLSDSTKYILIDRTAADADIDVTVRTGGATIDTDTTTPSLTPVFVIATRSGSSYEAAVVVAADTDVSNAVDTDSVVYLAKQPKDAVRDGWSATLYFMDGSHEDVTVDQRYTGATFYNYTVNSDGVYELSNSGNIGSPLFDNSTATSYTYSDGTGWVAGTLDSIHNNTTLSLDDITGATGSDIGQFYGINIIENETQVVDARSSKTLYTNDIDTLSKLNSAMNQGDVQVQLYLDDGNVLLIAVTGMTVNADSGSNAIQSVLDSMTSGTYDIDVTLNQRIDVTVPSNVTLEVDAAQPAGSVVTLESGAALTLPNGTTIGTGDITSTGELTVTVISGGKIRISASSGTITLGSSMTLSTGDELVLTGNAQLVGASTSVDLTVNGTISVTSSNSNFYTSGAATLITGNVDAGTYEWSNSINYNGETVSGWEAQ